MRTVTITVPDYIAGMILAEIEASADIAWTMLYGEGGADDEPTHTLAAARLARLRQAASDIRTALTH